MKKWYRWIWLPILLGLVVGIILIMVVWNSRPAAPAPEQEGDCLGAPCDNLWGCEPDIGACQYAFCEFCPEHPYCMGLPESECAVQPQCKPEICMVSALQEATPIPMLDFDAGMFQVTTPTPAPSPTPTATPTVTPTPEPRYTLGNFVWDDTDQDGIQDVGEVGIAGVTVELYEGSVCEGTLVDTTITFTGGGYEFDAVPPGTYSIKFTAPAGWQFSPQDQGTDDTVDSDPDMTGCIANIVL